MEGCDIVNVLNTGVADIAVESAVEYSFVKKVIRMRRICQYKAELTLSLACVCVIPLITAITALVCAKLNRPFSKYQNS